MNAQPAPLSDDEREEHIRACGRLMEKAYREGDTNGARRWLALQNEAIAGRSPERIAEMEREKGLGTERCYFSDAGDVARREAIARGAQ